MSKKLYLENLGILKKAHIHLDGLSVIAGYNDTGKSTVGKVLMALIKTHNICQKAKKSGKMKKKAKEFDKLLDLIFDFELNNAKIILSENEEELYRVLIGDEKCLSFESKGWHYRDCTFIQSPLVWDLYEFFSTINIITRNYEIYGGGFKLSYPYLLWDLYQKIALPPLDKYDNFKQSKEELVEIMQGRFLKNNQKIYKFYRNNKEISLKNVSMGIKQLGILQVLLDNNRITPWGFLIFDEPENHLHPKWQLKFADILTQLAAKNIPILVNTHSPYMVEALYKYAITNKTKINLHLSFDNKIEQIKNNEKTMELIFEKLNEPFNTFDELDRKNGRF